jgi:hypothetical protein
MHMMKPSALRENCCVPLGRLFSEKLLAPISALAGSGGGYSTLAWSNGLVVSVRGGGHNVSGNAVSDGGLMIRTDASSRHFDLNGEAHREPTSHRANSLQHCWVSQPL